MFKSEIDHFLLNLIKRRRGGSASLAPPCLYYCAKSNE